MAFPAQCPRCRTLLAFPEQSSGAPVRCPVCNSRYIIEGRRAVHLGFTDFYSILDIEPDSSEATIRRAVRSMVLKHHPDRNPNDPEATERIRDILMAKELLTDPAKRRHFDSVYNAPPLPMWQAYAQQERYARPQYPPPPSSRSSRVTYEPYEPPPPPRQERTRRQYEDIDHLIDEIDIIFMQAGVPINIRGRRWRSYRKVKTIWQVIGAMSVGLAGVVFGIVNGTGLGAALLGILGAVAGWLLTAYPGGLVVLAFFIARMFVFSVLLSLVASKLATGSWLPGELGRLLVIFNTSAIMGSIALGLWWIGASTFQTREPFFVHHMVHRQGALGAWMGALWAFFIVTVMNLSNMEMQAMAGWWLGLFTVYLILDTQLFGRTWVIISDHR
jgi:DNA-directed RNA polymerase subunit RPC12/RpoP